MPLPPALLAGLLLLAAPSAAAPEEVPARRAVRAPAGPPSLDVPWAAAATGGMLLLAGASARWKADLVAPACRWCEPGPLDRWARSALRWPAPGSAAAASDVAMLAVPAGAALALGLGAWRDGAGARGAAEDLLVVTEAAAAATLLTQAAKFGVARLRPDAWAAGGAAPGADARLSFWSGHTAFAFSVAAAATQVARLRGRPGWRWLAVASFAGAAATGWLRVAGDRHWLTDVATGALVGTATGLAVPCLVLHPAGAGGPALALEPAPGGLALRF